MSFTPNGVWFKHVSLQKHKLFPFDMNLIARVVLAHIRHLNSNKHYIHMYIIEFSVGIYFSLLSVTLI